MRIVVFGAAGRTGQEVVDQGLERDHEIVAFDRDTSALPDRDRLTRIESDVAEFDAVSDAVRGADAAVSVLGMTGNQERVLTRWAENAVVALNNHGVERVVTLTGAGVPASDDPERTFGGRIIRMLLQFMAGDVLEDGKRHAEIISASGLKWTVVRAPRLTSGDQTGEYRTGYLRLGLRDTVPRADVASFLLDLAEDDELYRWEMPLIASE